MDRREGLETGSPGSFLFLGGNLDARLAGLRETDGDGLLRVSHAMFPFPGVVDLLADVLSGARGRRASAPLVIGSSSALSHDSSSGTTSDRPLPSGVRIRESVIGDSAIITSPREPNRTGERPEDVMMDPESNLQTGLSLSCPACGESLTAAAGSEDML